MIQLTTSKATKYDEFMQVCVPVTWRLFKTVHGLQQNHTMARWDGHSMVRVPHLHAVGHRCMHSQPSINAHTCNAQQLWQETCVQL